MNPDDATAQVLSQFAQDIASVIPSVDSETSGQYGPGLGSEPEERQVKLVLEALRRIDESYSDADREVVYPNRTAACDIVLNNAIPVEVKLLRYWRANGDPEPNWYKHVFSPFNSNTLLTDARRLHESEFQKPSGLLGLFYTRGQMTRPPWKSYPRSSKCRSWPRKWSETSTIGISLRPKSAR